MLILALASWWYGSGWVLQGTNSLDRLHGALETFSIKQLLLTLFSPFRQISAGQVRGPIGVQLRAFGDRLISRLVGAVVRLIVIAIGTVWLALIAVMSSLWLVAWPLIPFLPVIAGVLIAVGVR